MIQENTNAPKPVRLCCKTCRREEGKGRQENKKKKTLQIVPERVLVLFQARTMSLRSGLRTFFVPEADHARHFR